MTTNANSPTPWEHGWDKGITGPEAAAALQWNNKYPIRCYGMFGMDRLVAAVPEATDGSHERIAALIVHAVNSHAELVEALRDALDDLNHHTNTDTPTMTRIRGVLARMT
jgi:hypothetical protein